MYDPASQVPECVPHAEAVPPAPVSPGTERGLWPWAVPPVSALCLGPSLGSAPICTWWPHQRRLPKWPSETSSTPGHPRVNLPASGGRQKGSSRWQLPGLPASFAGRWPGQPLRSLRGWAPASPRPPVPRTVSTWRCPSEKQQPGQQIATRRCGPANGSEPCLCFRAIRHLMPVLSVTGPWPYEDMPPGGAHCWGGMLAGHRDGGKSSCSARCRLH